MAESAKLQTSNCTSDTPRHKDTIDIVFSLYMKNVRITFSVSESALGLKVRIMCEGFHKGNVFGISSLFYS